LEDLISPDFPSSLSLPYGNAKLSSPRGYPETMQLNLYSPNFLTVLLPFSVEVPPENSKENRGQ